MQKCVCATFQVGQLLHAITKRLGVSNTNSFALYQAFRLSILSVIAAGIVSYLSYCLVGALFIRQSSLRDRCNVACTTSCTKRLSCAKFALEWTHVPK